MVSLPASSASPRPGTSWNVRFRSLRGKFVDFAELFGAAVRVARAVEARRPSDPADLETLGIKGPLPKTW
jgi:hypothetical protein